MSALNFFALRWHLRTRVHGVRWFLWFAQCVAWQVSAPLFHLLWCNSATRSLSYLITKGWGLAPRGPCFYLVTSATVHSSIGGSVSLSQLCKIMQSSIFPPHRKKHVSSLRHNGFPRRLRKAFLGFFRWQFCSFLSYPEYMGDSVGCVPDKRWSTIHLYL